MAIQHRNSKFDTDGSVTKTQDLQLAYGRHSCTAHNDDNHSVGE